MNDSNASGGAAKKKPCLLIRIVSFVIPWKGDGISDIIRKLILIAALAVFIATAIPLVTDVYSMHKDEQLSQEMADIYVPIENVEQKEEQGGILPAFEELLKINKDVVGFIEIEGTKLKYPVVKGEDNDYYLTHDINGGENKSGTVMMDCENVVEEDRHSANYILYGHNMAIGTYFAGLCDYWHTLYDSYDAPTMSAYKEHPVIKFDTLYEQAQWKIFAVGLYNTNYGHGEVFDYIHRHDFKDKEEFNDYIIEVMDRSDLFTDVDIQYGDEILTLSTCYWPYENNDYIRLAVFARKVRDGESAEVNVEAAQVNAYVKRWQWVYDKISNGYDWSQSTWDRRKLLSYSEEEAEQDGYTFIEDEKTDEEKES